MLIQCTSYFFNVLGVPFLSVGVRYVPTLEQFLDSLDRTSKIICFWRHYRQQRCGEIVSEQIIALTRTETQYMKRVIVLVPK